MDIENLNLKETFVTYTIKRNSIEPRILCMLKMMKWVSFIRMDYAYQVFDKHHLQKNPRDYQTFVELMKEEVRYYHFEDKTIEDELMEKEAEIYMEFKIYKDTYEQDLRKKRKEADDKKKAKEKPEKPEMTKGEKEKIQIYEDSVASQQ